MNVWDEELWRLCAVAGREAARCQDWLAATFEEVARPGTSLPQASNTRDVEPTAFFEAYVGRTASVQTLQSCWYSTQVDKDEARRSTDDRNRHQVGEVQIRSRSRWLVVLLAISIISMHTSFYAEHTKA